MRIVREHNAKITPLWCQNAVATSCWRHNNVILCRVSAGISELYDLDVYGNKSTSALYSVYLIPPPPPPLMPHISVNELYHHWSKQWLVACMVRSHYLNQCWTINNWIHRNNIQWDLMKIQTFLFTKRHLTISSAKWQPLCPGGGVGVMS